MKKYIFVGNRFHVLKTMLENGIQPVKILTIKDSFLEKELKKTSTDFSLLENKEHLCDLLSSTKFDCLISNGCPFIIPVTTLKKPNQIFANVHPSFLPDLKGRNPVNGAILYNRPAGATCHIMDDNIDTGPIIARIKIPLTADIDLGLLYQLAFMAEKEVFLNSLKKKFIPEKNSYYPGNDSLFIYYTRKENDRVINFNECTEKIIRRIKAFGIASQGAYFNFHGNTFYVLDAEEIINTYLTSKLENYADLEIAFVYSNTIVIRKENVFLKLKGIIGEMSKFETGKKLY